MTSPVQKFALVTGAGKRIGRVIALALAERGWDIAVHYGKSAGEAAQTVAAIRALGRKAEALDCDLANEADTRALLRRASAAMDGASAGCVINNAALFDYDNAESFSVARLDAHMHANLAAPVLLAQELHRATPDGMQAVVVNLLDQKLFNMNPDFLSYTLSKAALQAATTMLAQTLGPKIRVVGVAPGLTMESHLQSADDFAATHALSPLGESSRPEEVAAAVAFAVENRALTGSTILVDAGQHLMALPRDFSFIKRNQ